MQTLKLNYWHVLLAEAKNRLFSQLQLHVLSSYCPVKLSFGDNKSLAQS